MDNEKDEADILKPAEEEVDLDTTPAEESGSKEESDEEADNRLEEETKARLKAEQLAEGFKIRAEKAERHQRQAEKKAQDTTKVESKSALSYKDTIALTKANVHEDDVDELMDMAKFKNMHLAEFLNTSLAKTIISDSSEKRNTAEATNTGKTRSGNASSTGKSLLSKARLKGEMPDSDEDLDKLIEERFKR